MRLRIAPECWAKYRYTLALAYATFHRHFEKLNYENHLL